jgi:hypothetical protein
MLDNQNNIRNIHHSLNMHEISSMNLLYIQYQYNMVQ